MQTGEGEDVFVVIAVFAGYIRTIVPRNAKEYVQSVRKILLAAFFLRSLRNSQ